MTWGRDDVARVLRIARGLLASEGWCQGLMVDGVGRRCLFTALSAAAERDARELLAVAVVELASITGHLPGETGRAALTRWNDVPGRTLSDVVSALDMATTRLDHS